MILYVNRKVLKVDSYHVRRDVDLESILDNTKYYDKDDWEKADSEGYSPLNFAVSIRSLESNRVIETSLGDLRTYYTNLRDVQEFPHKGYDLIMFLTSLGVLHNVNYTDEVGEIMLKYSQFQPIGTYCSSSDFLDPIIYSHILMSDVGLNLLEPHLKSDREIVRIEDMKFAGNLVPLLDTLILIKETQRE